MRHNTTIRHGCTTDRMNLQHQITINCKFTRPVGQFSFVIFYGNGQLGGFILLISHHEHVSSFRS